MDKKNTLILGMGAMLSVSIMTMNHASAAYIDPSVTTFAIQAIVGVAVAAGAVVTVWWRKAKKKVNKALNIDENRNKETEGDLQEIDPIEKK